MATPRDPAPDPTTESLLRRAAGAVRSEGMGGPFKRNATYDDLDTIPDTWVGEIIDGDLYAFPRAASPHAVVVTELPAMLTPMRHDDSPAGWVILADVEVRFGTHLLVPDISGWRRARMPVIPELTVFELAPDWVCEVMSPSTARQDRGRKREIYAAGKVGHIWYLDPVHHTLEVLALDGASYRVVATAGEDELGRFAPFESIELQLAQLWRR